jgi:hypothetical protein
MTASGAAAPSATSGVRNIADVVRPTAATPPTNSQPAFVRLGRST